MEGMREINEKEERGNMVPKSFDKAWDGLIDYLSLRHSIESDIDVGTPPYEESRYFGWADQGDDPEHEGYDDPWSRSSESECDNEDDIGNIHE